MPDPVTGKDQKGTSATINGIYEDQFEEIFKFDQMARDSVSHGLAKYGFREGHPEQWAPTFKLKKDKGKNKDKKKGDE